jgi:hypothetical protein
MRRLIALITAAITPLAASGCATDDEAFLRMDGVTPWVGDSQAADTVMQLVDPWQPGVENTRLRVPAQMGPAPSLADEAAESKTMQSDNP